MHCQPGGHILTLPARQRYTNLHYERRRESALLEGHGPTSMRGRLIGESDELLYSADRPPSPRTDFLLTFTEKPPLYGEPAVSRHGIELAELPQAHKFGPSLRTERRGPQGRPGVTRPAAGRPRIRGVLGAGGLPARHDRAARPEAGEQAGQANQGEARTQGRAEEGEAREADEERGEERGMIGPRPRRDARTLFRVRKKPRHSGRAYRSGRHAIGTLTIKICPKTCNFMESVPQMVST